MIEIEKAVKIAFNKEKKSAITVVFFSHSFIDSFICSFVRSFVRSFIRSFFLPFIHLQQTYLGIEMTSSGRYTYAREILCKNAAKI